MVSGFSAGHSEVYIVGEHCKRFMGTRRTSVFCNEAVAGIDAYEHVSVVLPLYKKWDNLKAQVVQQPQPIISALV
jgi:hypothetical protein